jgi:hypothetical protein
MDGEGVFVWPDGRKYHGQYKDDKKEGYGVFEWYLTCNFRNDGRKYKGMWKNGKQHGEGEFWHPKENSWKRGIWNDGKRVRWTNENNAPTPNL